jgi:arsenite oxidase small subunit
MVRGFRARAEPLRRENRVSVTDDHDRTISRRGLLGAGVAGAAVAAGVEPAVAAAQAAGYPRLKIADVKQLKVNRPISFDYPLKGQSNMLIDLGDAVPEGVGSKKSIVAYSTLCQHMGCPVSYDRELREFRCPCHQTRYDPERLASIIQGVATRALPRVLLQVKGGAVWAVGVDGLVYGYRTNLAPGQKVKGKS